MKNIALKTLGTLGIVILMGAGCMPGSTNDTNNTNNTNTPVQDPNLEHFTEEESLWKVSFDYPKGYTVTGGGTDSFTGYDITPEGDDTPRIRILISDARTGAADSFINATTEKTNTEQGNLTIATHAKIGDNNLINDIGEVHYIVHYNDASNPWKAIIIDLRGAGNNLEMLYDVAKNLEITDKSDVQI